ncbi:MAG TPA: hypothetical protein VHC22_17880 [Pirellulales bacterium]|nr:hypothetical protein [Pirellulales bacterium]
MSEQPDDYSDEQGNAVAALLAEPSEAEKRRFALAALLKKQAEDNA